jgi:hypothetical protein
MAAERSREVGKLWLQPLNYSSFDRDLILFLTSSVI